MSELAVNKALKVFIENSVIPELEAKIRKLEKLETLYANALDVIAELDPDQHGGDEIVCYDCIKLVDYENTDKCYACNGNICFDCVPKFTRRICKTYNIIIHLECDDKSYSCDKCNCCSSCCKCKRDELVTLD